MIAIALRLYTSEMKAPYPALKNPRKNLPNPYRLTKLRRASSKVPCWTRDVWRVTFNRQRPVRRFRCEASEVRAGLNRVR